MPDSHHATLPPSDYTHLGRTRQSYRAQARLPPKVQIWLVWVQVYPAWGRQFSRESLEIDDFLKGNISWALVISSNTKCNVETLCIWVPNPTIFCVLFCHYYGKRTQLMSMDIIMNRLNISLHPACCVDVITSAAPLLPQLSNGKFIVCDCVPHKSKRNALK